MLTTPTKKSPRPFGGPLLAAMAGALLLSFVCVDRAHAHPLVEAGVAYTNEARFDEADAAFDRAFRGHGLTRADLIVLLAHRALVHFALREQEALDTDLRMLAALEPTYAFPAYMPPQVQARFAEHRGARLEPRVSAVVRFRRESVAVEVSLEGFATGLVQDVQVTAREPSGQWQSGQGTNVMLPIHNAQAIEWYVEVIGPGRAVIAKEGAPLEPRRTVDASAAVATSTAEDEGGRAWRWWAVGGGAAAAIVITTLAIVFAGRGDDRNHVGAPVLR